MKKVVLAIILIITGAFFSGCNSNSLSFVPDIGDAAGTLTYTVSNWTDANNHYHAMLKFNHDMYIKLNQLQDQIRRAKSEKIAHTEIYYGNPNIRAVALTFDDGPHPWSTKKLLAVLKKYHVKATFFVVGKMCQQYPQLLKAIYDDGHLIANHTYNHKNLLRLTPAQIDEEWRMGNNTIRTVLGIKVDFCRPPGGNFDYIVTDSAKKKGLTTVLWTDDPGDYAQPGKEVIMDKFLDFLDTGGIILLHDGPQQTIDVLPEMIKEIRKRGYKFQTMDEMARDLK
ncbi:MAG: polysaccharide deacetylase family protein [Firmicutes bacterium]|nr:polysaccharide deacetylase family protein [Bacillota bacterium]